MKLWSSLLLCLLSTSCVLVPKDGGVDLHRLGNVLDGAKVSKVEAFRGEELYNYMNGAATTYLEHGRVELTSADVVYEGVASKVELYTLVSPVAADKVYAEFASSDGGERLPTGTPGTIWPSTEPEAIFQRGPYFVRIMAYAGDATTGKRVATAVALAADRLLAQ